MAVVVSDASPLICLAAIQPAPHSVWRGTGAGRRLADRRSPDTNRLDVSSLDRERLRSEDTTSYFRPNLLGCPSTAVPI
jgi:hypothetical protein